MTGAGVPEKVAMTITGHKTRAIFDRYHIVSEADKTQGIEKLARFRQGQAATAPTVVSLQAATSAFSLPMELRICRE